MPCRSRTRRSISQPSMPGIITSSMTRSGGSPSSAAQALLGRRGLAHDHAVELEVDADELAQARIVVDDQDDGVAARPRARAVALDERVEVGAHEPAMAARRVEHRRAGRCPSRPAPCSARCPGTSRPVRASTRSVRPTADPCGGAGEFAATHGLRVPGSRGRRREAVTVDRDGAFGDRLGQDDLAEVTLHGRGLRLTGAIAQRIAERDADGEQHERREDPRQQPPTAPSRGPAGRPRVACRGLALARHAGTLRRASASGRPVHRAARGAGEDRIGDERRVVRPGLPGRDALRDVARPASSCRRRRRAARPGCTSAPRGAVRPRRIASRRRRARSTRRGSRRARSSRRSPASHSARASARRGVMPTRSSSPGRRRRRAQRERGRARRAGRPARRRRGRAGT